MTIRSKTIHVKSVSCYDLDMNINDLIEFLGAIRDELVPEEFRASVRVDHKSGDYEGDSGTLEICYIRPETPDETAARESNERAERVRKDGAERAEFERLRAKFGK